MAVMISNDDLSLILDCNCGCGSALKMRIELDDDLEDYCYLEHLNSNWYADQENGWNRFRKKVKKCWAVLRNKDFFYAEQVLSRADLGVLYSWLERATSES